MWTGSGRILLSVICDSQAAAEVPVRIKLFLACAACDIRTMDIVPQRCSGSDQ